MTSPSSSRTLLIFARDPRPGRVKTRLIPALGAEGAVRIYRKLLRHSLETATAAKAERVELWLDHPSEDPELLRLLDRLGIYRRTQTGNDLGARMQHALQDALHEAERVVLIGSDCPAYTAAYLDAAFDALDEHDAVIGPAVDGGYVLIGLRKAAPTLFKDIAWGSEQVLATTRTRLTALRWHWHELEALRDVDVPDDLAAYPHLITGVPKTPQTEA